MTAHRSAMLPPPQPTQLSPVSLLPPKSSWRKLVVILLVCIVGLVSSMISSSDSKAVTSSVSENGAASGQSSSADRGPVPETWRPVQEISFSRGSIQTGDSETSVRHKVPEPVEWEVPIDPEVRIQLANETVRSIKKIDTFFIEGKWFRLSMWRKVPKRPYLVAWKGYDEPGEFVVYRIEIPKEEAQQAGEPADEHKLNYPVASDITIEKACQDLDRSESRSLDEYFAKRKVVENEALQWPEFIRYQASVLANGGKPLRDAAYERRLHERLLPIMIAWRDLQISVWKTKQLEVRGCSGATLERLRTEAIDGLRSTTEDIDEYESELGIR